MTRFAAIDEARQSAIISSGAGYPFLLVFAFVWTAASLLSFVVPREMAPWVGAWFARRHARATARGVVKSEG